MSIALQKQIDLAHDVERLAKQIWPVGSTIQWLHGQHVRTAMVVSHAIDGSPMYKQRNGYGRVHPLTLMRFSGWYADYTKFRK